MLESVAFRDGRFEVNDRGEVTRLTVEVNLSRVALGITTLQLIDQLILCQFKLLVPDA